MITDALLLDVFEGRMDPDKFFRQTHQDWHRLADSIFKRWHIPGWFTLEEFAQDLRMFAWQYIWTFDPTFGTSIRTHVLYESIRRGEKEIHKKRNVNRHRGTSTQKTLFLEQPSRVTLVDGDEYSIQAADHISPSVLAEARIAVDRAMAQCTTEIEEQVVKMMAESVDFSDEENIERRVLFLNQFANRPKGCRKKFQAA